MPAHTQGVVHAKTQPDSSRRMHPPGVPCANATTAASANTQCRGSTAETAGHVAYAPALAVLPRRWPSEDPAGFGSTLGHAKTLSPTPPTPGHTQGAVHAWTQPGSSRRIHTPGVPLRRRRHHLRPAIAAGSSKSELELGTGAVQLRLKRFLGPGPDQGQWIRGSSRHTGRLKSLLRSVPP